jgi:4-hydroxy 2-oxovalerate aldolase
MKNIKLLDCTFRDGGYYNNWNFSYRQLNEYVKKISDSKIDVIEIGFRFLEKNNLFGSFAYCKESLLSKLKYLNKTKIAVMVNSDDFFKFDKNPEYLFNNNFIHSTKSKISIIRFATRIEDIPKICNLLILAKKKGYKVFVNLMQINRVSNRDLVKCLKILKKTYSVDVFYFADTFGSLTPNNVENICKIIKKNWSLDFGIHAHDNCGFALENSIRAISFGANWIDSTVQGMGRGAGNVSTESVVCELSRMGVKKFKPEFIYSLSQSYFQELKKKYQWGKSIYYHLAAINNIHPSYIQELLIDNRYSYDQIIIILDQLKRTNSSSFNPNFLKNIINQKIDFNRTWNVKNYFLNKKIVLLGQGDNLANNKNKIIRFIKKNDCVVISLNINRFFNKNEIDYYLASNEARILIDTIEYKKINKDLILPINLIKNLINIKKIKKIKNYGLITDSAKIKSFDNYCILPNTMAIGYATALLCNAGAKEIYLSGFDGYNSNSELQTKMNNYLMILQNNFKKMKFFSLTPTMYSLKIKKI